MGTEEPQQRPALGPPHTLGAPGPRGRVCCCPRGGSRPRSGAQAAQRAPAQKPVGPARPAATQHSLTQRPRPAELHGATASAERQWVQPAPLNHPVFWLPGPHLPTHPTHSPPSPILSPRLLKPCQLSSALTSPLFCFSTLCLSLSSLCVLCLALSLSSSFCLSPLLCHPFLVFQFLAVSLPLLQQCFLYPPGLGSSHSSDPEPLLSPSLPHFV